MGILHARLVGFREGDVAARNVPPLDPEEVYAIDVVCRDKRLAQFLMTQIQAFMASPSMDAEVSRILNGTARAGGEWLEEYAARAQGLA